MITPSGQRLLASDVLCLGNSGDCGRRTRVEYLRGNADACHWEALCWQHQPGGAPPRDGKL